LLHKHVKLTLIYIEIYKYQFFIRAIICQT